MSNTLFDRTLGANAYAPRTISDSGVVTINLDIAENGALLLLDGGTITGLQMNDLSETDVTSNAAYHAFVVYVAAASGNSGTITHQAGGVGSDYKIRVATTAASISVTEHSLIKLIYSPDEGQWVAYNIGPADSDSYTPAVSGNWVTSAPTTKSGGLDRLVARVEYDQIGVHGVSMISGGTANATWYGPAGVIEEITYYNGGGLTLISTSTMTPSINGTPITNGATTFPIGILGANTKRTATPSGANTLATGDQVTVACTGANLLAGSVSATFKIRVKS